MSVKSMENMDKLSAKDKLTEVIFIEFIRNKPIKALIICPPMIFLDRENGLLGKVKIITQLAAIGGINSVIL